MKTLLTLLLLISSLCWGLDKDELKEELKYWKSLLDDELITQKDYNQKKEELINISTKSNKSYKKTNNNDFINNIKNIFDSDEKSKDEESPKESNKYLTKYKDFPLYEDSVLNIQKAFVSMGFDISADGIYGSETKGVLDYWMNCNNYTKFNAKKYYDLINGMGCTSENYSDKKINRVFCLPDSVYLYDGVNEYLDMYYKALIPRIDKCTKQETKIEPQWCNWSKDNQPNREILMDVCAQNNQIVKSTKVENKKNSTAPVTNIKKDLSKDYDAIVKFGYTKLCEIPYKFKCDKKNTLLTLKEGDYLKIKDSKIVFKQNSVSVKTEKNFNGYVHLDKIKIFEPNKFKHSHNTTNNSKSTTTVSNNNTNNNTLKNSSSSDKCSGLNSDKNWVYKGLTGYFSKKDACLKIASYSDDELCSQIERREDMTINAYENHYKKEASSRGVACIDGIAFDKSDSTTKILQSQKKLEEKMEKKMACTARRTEWRTLCKTGDYRMVNGVMCFSTFRC